MDEKFTGAAAAWAAIAFLAFMAILGIAVAMVLL
jgi:hypothetical protein